MRIVRHTLEFVAFKLASGLLSLLPFRAAGIVGGWLGAVAFTIFGLRRGVVLENLHKAFPEANADRIRSIAVESFRSVGTALFELLRFSSLREDSLKAVTRVVDADLVRKPVERGRGVVLLTAHFGNWELLPQAILVHTGVSSLILYKVQSNRLIDREIASRRTRFGNQIVPMGISVREIIKALKGGRCVAMAVDQSAPKESVRMKFFGRDVPVFQGASAFALKTGAALVAAFVIRQPDGSYHIQGKEIRSDDLQDDDEGIRELTRRHLAETERTIREFPGQWMWMHRRWKHSDDGSEERHEKD